MVVCRSARFDRSHDGDPDSNRQGDGDGKDTGRAHVPSMPLARCCLLRIPRHQSCHANAPRPPEGERSCARVIGDRLSYLGDPRDLLIAGAVRLTVPGLVGTG